MVRSTTPTDDESTTTTATVYHRKFSTADGDRHEVGADLGMGYDWAVDHDADPEDPDVFADAYDYAGTVEVDPKPGVESAHAAAYKAWENGEGHDTGSTRSMATGDIIVVDDDAYFVDRIGFEPVDLPTDDDGGADGDLLTPSDEEIADAFGVDDVGDITDEMLDDVDVPEPPERVDVSGYKTAAGAAKATAKCLRDWAEFYDYDRDSVVVYDPEEAATKRDFHGDAPWVVAWEGGFYEWATWLTGGESITSGEGYGTGGEPEVAGLLDGDGFGVECYYSFDICFYNR